MENTSRLRRAFPYAVIIAATTSVAIYAYVSDVFVVVLMMLLLLGSYCLAMQYRKDAASRR